MKLPRNEKGISLVEVLAVFVIFGIITLLIISLYLYTQTHATKQRESALQLTDITIAMNEITRDIRTYDIKEVNAQKIEFANNNVYELKETILYKNGTPFIYDIDRFDVHRSDDEVSIKISSRSGQEIETTLLLR